MAFQSSPVYYFDDMSSSGIKDVPINKLVIVISNSNGYVKVSNDFIDETSTILDAYNVGALKVSNIISREQVDQFIEDFLSDNLGTSHSYDVGTEPDQIPRNRDITLTELELNRYSLRSQVTTGELDLSLNQVFRINAVAPLVISFVNPPPQDRSMIIVLNIEGAANISWPAEVVWSNNIAPLLGASWTTILLNWTGVRWTGSVGAKA